MRSVSPLTLGLIFLPVLELLIFIRVGSSIGLFATLLLMFAMTILGGFLVRQQGALAFQRFKTALRNGQAPNQELGEGIAVLMGGILLLIPGFFTDILGFLCLIPATRPWMVKTVRNYLQRSGGHSFTSMYQSSSSASYHSNRRVNDSEQVIEGEVIERTEPKR